MKRTSKIHRQVKEEVDHIHRGPTSSTQNYFRQMYSARRMHDLANTIKSKQETLKEVWNHFKKDEPNFIPSYDHTYFKVEP